MATAQALTKTDDSGKEHGACNCRPVGPLASSTGWPQPAASSSAKMAHVRRLHGLARGHAGGSQFYADLYNKHKVAPPPADMNVLRRWQQ